MDSEMEQGDSPQTLQSNDELRFPSRQSGHINNRMVDTPTDESTLPHSRLPSNAQLQHQPVSSQKQSCQRITQQTNLAEAESLRSPKLQRNSTSHSDHNSQKRQAHVYQSTPIYNQEFSLIPDARDSRELVDQLQHTISLLEAQISIVQNHAETQMQKLLERYNEQKDELDRCIEVLANERIHINEEKTELANQLANTRVELKSTKDQLRSLQQRHTGDTQDLNKKLKNISDERIREKSELSGLKVKLNDAKRAFNEQKTKLEKVTAENQKLKDSNSSLMTKVTQLRLQNQGLQQSLQTERLNEDFPTGSSRSSTQNLSRNINHKSVQEAAPASTRQSRSSSSLRFSNRTQVRDITPPDFTSLNENYRTSSPQGVESEIHTASCRYDCHLFEHEGDEGRFRWVCGINERIVVVYREQRYVIFVPDVAEIQFFGEGSYRGQLIVFWSCDQPTKEITLCRVNGSREDYRIDAKGDILYREVFNHDGTAFRVTGEEIMEIALDEATPLLTEVKMTQQGASDFQIQHRAFGLRVVNYEFLRVQILAERLQITMCLCENRRVFNVKHCSEGFQQKSLCTFLGQCPNMQIR